MWLALTLPSDVRIKVSLRFSSIANSLTSVGSFSSTNLMHVQVFSVSLIITIFTVPVLAISVTFFVRFTMSLNYNLHSKYTFSSRTILRI